MEVKGKRAYVTLLAGDDDYFKGVVGLAKGLRKVKSEFPLVVAVLPDVPVSHRKLVEAQGCLVREIEPVYLPAGETKFEMAYYVINYSKLRIWEFIEYEKIIYLDADIQIYSNIDHLFDLPNNHFYAVMDCFCEKTWSHTPQYRIKYGQQCPDKVTWPVEELGSPPPPYFNASVFVAQPNLVVELKITPTTPFAEQDFLNVFCKDKPIPLICNLVMATLWRHPENVNLDKVKVVHYCVAMLWRHPENVDLDKVKVVHYCAAGSKPWRYTGEEENMDREDVKMSVKKWWDIYNDVSLNYKGPTIAGLKNPVRSTRAKVGTIRYVHAPLAA